MTTCEDGVALMTDRLCEEPRLIAASRAGSRSALDLLIRHYHGQIFNGERWQHTGTISGKWRRASRARGARMDMGSE